MRLTGDTVFRQRQQERSWDRRTVQEDWVAWLPSEKRELFEAVQRRWEDAYAMLSVALNEALSLRAESQLVRAREVAGVAAEILDHLVEPLFAALRAIESRGQRLPKPPAAAPLDTAFFRGDTARSAASWDLLLHRVLFGNRSRFLHKIRSLEGIVEELSVEFKEFAGELAQGTSTQPEKCWMALDFLHYDLNTCLRETVVILKSFLVVLPESDLGALRRELEAPVVPWQRKARPRLSQVRT